MVFLAFQVIQADKDQRDLRASKVSLEPTEKRELGEPQGNLAQEAREDQRDRVVREDRGDLLGKQDPRETLEAMDLQDLLERGVCQDLKDQLDSLDQRAHLVQLEKMDCPDTLDREERLVSKARLAPQALPAWSDPRGRQVRPDKWETGATRVPQAHLVSRVCPAQQAKKEPRVIQDLLVPLVRTVLLVSEGSPETEVYPVPWVLMA